MTKKSWLKVVFFAQIALFGLFIINLFLPRELIQGSLFFLIMLAIFVLGLVLIIFTWKVKPKKRLKQLLLLTGFSSSGFFLASFLHNFFYALEILFKNIWFLSLLMGFLHMLFFLVAIILCPIGFLIGVFGSICLGDLLDKEKKIVSK